MRTAPAIVEGRLIEQFRPGRVALRAPGRALPLGLDPFLLFRETELAEELLFLNSERSKQVEYISYATGRTERDRSTTKALAGLLGRVTGRAIDEQALAALAEKSLAETPSIELLLGPPTVAGPLIGGYVILAEIGRGGMGIVYLARQASLGRLVALKTLPSDLVNDKVALARFQREMRLLARCDHPNIVKVLDNGVADDGRYYYAMEYVPGCDLDQVSRELSNSDRPGDLSTLGSSSWTSGLVGE